VFADDISQHNKNKGQRATTINQCTKIVDKQQKLLIKELREQLQAQSDKLAEMEENHTQPKKISYVYNDAKDV